MSDRIMSYSRRGVDIFDLAAAIVAQARYEWQEPMMTDYHAICWGDEAMGWEPCPFRWECYPVRSSRTVRSRRYHECLRRRSLLKQELIKFFNSDWFEFLCGGIDPDYVRQTLKIPNHKSKGGKHE